MMAYDYHPFLTKQPNGFPPDFLKRCKVSHVKKFFEKYPIENLVVSDRSYITYSLGDGHHRIDANTRIHYTGGYSNTIIVIKLMQAVAKHYKVNLLFKVTNGRYKGSILRGVVRRLPGYHYEDVRLVAEGKGVHFLEVPFTWCIGQEEKFKYVPKVLPRDDLGVSIEEGDTILLNKTPAVFWGWDDLNEQLQLNFGTKTVRRGLDVNDRLINLTKLNVTKLKGSILKKRLSKI